MGCLLTEFIVCSEKMTQVMRELKGLTCEERLTNTIKHVQLGSAMTGSPENHLPIAEGFGYRKGNPVCFKVLP